VQEPCLHEGPPKGVRLPSSTGHTPGAHVFPRSQMEDTGPARALGGPAAWGPPISELGQIPRGAMEALNRDHGAHRKVHGHRRNLGSGHALAQGHRVKTPRSQGSWEQGTNSKHSADFSGPRHAGTAGQQRPEATQTASPRPRPHPRRPHLASAGIPPAHQDRGSNRPST
jgi:hypothetical protein